MCFCQMCRLALCTWIFKLHHGTNEDGDASVPVVVPLFVRVQAQQFA